MQSHAFANACLYEVAFSGLDDDGGTDSDATDVVFVGTAQLIRSAGYWYHQYRGNGRVFFTATQLHCYLDVVNHLSSLVSEVVDADSRADAEAARLNPATPRPVLENWKNIVEAVNRSGGS